MDKNFIEQQSKILQTRNVLEILKDLDVLLIVLKTFIN